MSRLDKFEEILNSYEGREFEPVSFVSYADLDWQPRAYREPGEIRTSWKAQFYFDGSQEKLVQARYERHPFSAEAFSLIITYLEGKLPLELDEAAEDMLADHGEFFCQAIETAQARNGILSGTRIATIYELVTALPRNAKNDGYNLSGMKHSGTPKTFDVGDLELATYHYYKDIHNKHDDLIEYLTSRNYENLPDKIKENGGISLPRLGAVGSIGRSGFNIRYGIDGYDGNRASRGVRRAKISVGKKVKQ